MTETDFRQALKLEGYPEPAQVQWAANSRNEDHAHDFTAKGLVLEGSVRISSADSEQICAPGDTFFMLAGTPHAEVVGPDGAKLLIGKRQPT